jgi:hypothetical protein
MSIRHDSAGSVCARGPQPGTAALLAHILASFPGSASAGIYNCRSIVGGSTLSLHAEGRALDVRPAGAPRSRSQGDAIAHWAVANAERYQIQEVIWYRRIWTAKRAAEGWRKYTGAHSHTDHVHIGQNWTGAGSSADELDGIDVGWMLLIVATVAGVGWWTWK